MERAVVGKRSGVVWLNEGDPQGKAVPMSGYEADLITRTVCGPFGYLR